MKKANYYKKLENNQVQCQLCNHYCVVDDKQTGICGVRKNIEGELNSLVYGYPSGAYPDPIEKKGLAHFLPGSFTYSFGTLGCNFACDNCLNYDHSQAKDVEKLLKSFEQIDSEKLVANALDNSCDSIAYTYNEPTVFTEYALEIMKIARENKLKNVWVSNGFMGEECLRDIIPYLDAINVDLKSIDDKFYKTNCQGRVEPVLKNLKLLKLEQIHLEITTLIIPTLSSDIEMLKALANFIVTELDADTPWHITRFSPDISWRLKDKANTSEDLIYQAYDIGKEAGLKYVYAGNLPGDHRENTYCPKCKELAIRRLGYDIERMDIKGRCAYCDTSLDIIY